MLYARSLSRVRTFANPWTVACQAPLSMEFSRQEHWSGLPCPPPGDIPDPGIEPRSPTLQADSLPSEPPHKPYTSLMLLKEKNKMKIANSHPFDSYTSTCNKKEAYNLLLKRKKKSQFKTAHYYLIFMELNELSLHIFLSWNPKGLMQGICSESGHSGLAPLPSAGFHPGLTCTTAVMAWGGEGHAQGRHPHCCPRAASSWLCGRRFEASLREDWGFPGSSVGKQSACNAEDPSLIPGSGRSAGEGVGYPLQCSWASLAAQLVKNPLAMQDPWVGMIPWRRERLPTPVFWPGEFYGLYSPQSQCPRGW